MKKALATAAALLAMAVPTPTLAHTFKQINEFVDLIEQTGTDVVYTNCKEDFNKPDVYGFYIFDAETKVDHLILCKDHIDARDPAAIWETLAHEVTHVMQACHGGPVLKDEAIDRVLARMPEDDLEVLQQYPDEKLRIEVEAFNMENEDPALVVELFKRYCFE